MAFAQFPRWLIGIKFSKNSPRRRQTYQVVAKQTYLRSWRKKPCSASATVMLFSKSDVNQTSKKLVLLKCRSSCSFFHAFLLQQEFVMLEQTEDYEAQNYDLWQIYMSSIVAAILSWKLWFSYKANKWILLFLLWKDFWLLLNLLFGTQRLSLAFCLLAAYNSFCFVPELLWMKQR